MSGRPNILILYTDQQRWDAVGLNGNTAICTPSLDRLGAAGLNYRRHFVQNPVCMPSRVSFLSGQYPSQLRITHMGVPVPEELETIASLTSRLGYHTANIGKLHFLPHANRDHRLPHPRYGFDHLEISDEPGCYEDAYYAWVGRMAPDQLDRISCGLPPATAVWRQQMGITDPRAHPDRGEVEPRAFSGRDDLTHTAFVAERTIDFLRRQGRRQFCCVAGFYAPHSPWVAPQRYFDLYHPEDLPAPDYPSSVEARRGERFTDEKLRLAKQGYYAMISEVDHHVGRILDCLDQEGLADDTIVIFTSDHGEYLGEFLRFGKGFPGEDCISRVPLLVRWPSGLPAGVTVPHLVEAVDVLPSLLAWLGAPVPPQLQGRPLPLSAAPEAATRDSVLLEHSAGKSLRTERYRYVLRQEREELYDLANDFGEYADIAAEPGYAVALADCRRLLLQRLLANERPLPRTWAY